MAKAPAKRQRKVKHDPTVISTRIRAAFYNALDEVCRREDKALHEVMADWLQKDPHKTMSSVGQFFPKESVTEIGENLGSLLFKLAKEGRDVKQIGETYEHDTEEDPIGLRSDEKRSSSKVGLP